MSGQPPQRMRRIGSPIAKSGPIKATVRYPLIQGSPTRAANANGKKCSPSTSPTSPWSSDSHRNKSRRSPDHRASPERASPNSPCFNKDKTKRSTAAPIHRTRSLDTIAGPYLTGQWPKDLATYLPSPPPPPPEPDNFTSDKATQTPEDWDQDCSDRKRKNHKRSASMGNGDSLKEIKQRLQRTKEGSKQSAGNRDRHSPVHGNHNALGVPSTALIPSKAVAIPVPHIPKTVVPRFRGSVEGFNPEVERLFPKAFSGTEEEPDVVQTQAPDGHRAPVAELLTVHTTRSVDTQTPSGSVDEWRPVVFQDESAGSSSSSSNMSSRSQSESPSYITESMETDPMDCSDSRDEKIDKDENEDLLCKMSESPQPNQAFRREPPDGCEKIKLIEEIRRAPPMKPQLFCPVKPQHIIPSDSSAFCPLYKSYVNQVTNTTEGPMKALPNANLNNNLNNNNNNPMEKQ